MTRVKNCLKGRERLQIFGRGQLRDQVLLVDVHLHLALSRRQVQIEAPLEALLEVVLVGGHGAQVGEGGGHKVEASLFWLACFPLQPLILVKDKLGRRPIALGVAGQGEFWRRVRHSFTLLLCLGPSLARTPHVVELGRFIFGTFLIRLCLELNSTFDKSFYLFSLRTRFNNSATDEQGQFVHLNSEKLSILLLSRLSCLSDRTKSTYAV